MNPLEGPFVSPTERERMRQQDLEEAARKPRDHEWPPEVEDPEVTRLFWNDPHPENTAVLTGDMIREYHYAVGRMIRPFQEEHLNPASYDLTLGPRCLVDGEETVLSERSPVLRIPPGSIALAPSREMLFIPHWLVATFNLKSRYIFKGLLMGIGPQIDPGYMGVLTCPLHNVSCEPIDLYFCEPFAKLDFIRTNWGTTVDLSGIEKEDELYEKAAEKKLGGYEASPVPLWPREENFREPLITGREPAGVKGSLGDLKAQVRGFESKIEGFEGQLGRAYRIGWFGGVAVALAIVATVATITAYTLTYADGRVADAEDNAVRAARAEAKAALRELGYPERVGEVPRHEKDTPARGSLAGGDPLR